MPICALCNINVSTQAELAEHIANEHTGRPVGRVTHVTRIRAYGNGWNGDSAKARQNPQPQPNQQQAH